MMLMEVYMILMGVSVFYMTLSCFSNYFDQLLYNFEGLYKISNVHSYMTPQMRIDITPTVRFCMTRTVPIYIKSPFNVQSLIQIHCRRSDEGLKNAEVRCGAKADAKVP